MAKEIIIYGQDYSPINEAFYEEVNVTNKVRTVNKIDEKKLETLKKALLELENLLVKKSKKESTEADENEGLLVVGHAHEKDGMPDTEYHIYDPSKGEHGYFGSLVGTVRTRVGRTAVKIVIRSRFDDFDNNNPDGVKPYFLASLLLCGNLEFSGMNVDFSYDSLFHFYMIWVLKKHFQEALLKGLFKKYQRFERNDDRVRGAIDISRHIRLNLNMNNGKITYSYRENSYDNPINHLIVTAYHYLLDNYPDLTENGFDGDLVKTIRSLEYEIGYPKYDIRTIVSKNIDPVSHPYYFEYEQLRKDCLMILRDEGLSPFDNIDESVNGILYYVPDLWESYLMQFFEKGIYLYEKSVDEDGSGLKICVVDQKMVKVMIDPNNKGHSTYPDYWFTYYLKDKEKSVPFSILDAKYKTGWDAALHGDLRPDLLGDYDKALRDMVSACGTSSGVVFPKRSEGERDINSYTLVHGCSGYNSFQRFYTIPVMVPAAAERRDFYEWEREMSTGTENLMKEIIEKYLIPDALRKQKLLKIADNAFSDIPELEV